MSTLISGSTIGSLRVVCYVGATANRPKYECECKCENTFIAYKEHIASGQNLSCMRKRV